MPSAAAEHTAIITKAGDHTATVVDVVLEAVRQGQRILVIHGGGLSGTELGVALEGVEELQPGVSSIELLHRSAGPEAMAEAGARASRLGPGRLHVIVADAADLGTSDSCGRVEGLNEESAISCVFEASVAAGRCMATVLGHHRLQVGRRTIGLVDEVDRLLAVDLMLDALRREPDIERAVVSAAQSGLEPGHLDLVADRHLRRIQVRREAAELRGRATQERRRAEAALLDLHSRDEAEAVLRRSDGDVGMLLRAAAEAIRGSVLLEDAAFRLLRSEGWEGTATDTPLALGEVMSPGRLNTVAAGLEAGVPTVVRIGTPSAGSRQILRLGNRRLLGYVSFVSQPHKPEIGAMWLRRLEGPLTAALRQQQDLVDLTSGTRKHLVRLLITGSLGEDDAASVADFLGWQRGRSAQVAAAMTSTAGTKSVLAQLAELEARLERDGVPVTTQDGYVVMIESHPGERERILAVASASPGVAIGFGAVAATATGASRSFREATFAARMASASLKTSLDFDQLGIHRLLLPGSEAGDPKFEEPIRRLEEAADELNFDAIETLAAYLDAGAGPAAAARRLNVHVNTLRYRLERIEKVAQIELSDPEQRFRAQLALRLRTTRKVLRL
jgi:hypothetical protein